MTPDEHAAGLDRMTLNAALIAETFRALIPAFVAMGAAFTALHAARQATTGRPWWAGRPPGERAR